MVASIISPLSFLIYKVSDQYSPPAVSATAATTTTATAAASPATPSAATVQCTSSGETFCFESYFFFSSHLAILSIKYILFGLEKLFLNYTSIMLRFKIYYSIRDCDLSSIYHEINVSLLETARSGGIIVSSCPIFCCT